MPTRRRPVAEFEATSDKLGTQTVTLASLIGGYNGYTQPELLSPQFWAAASNCRAGQFGAVRRARWAPFLNSTTPGYTAHGLRILSMFSWAEAISNLNWLLFENNDPNAVSFSLSGVSYGPFPSRMVIANAPVMLFSTGLTGNVPVLVAPVWFYIDLQTSPQSFMFNSWQLSSSLLNGPYMRAVVSGLVLETNGLYRSKARVALNPTFLSLNTPPALIIGEYWGIDAPDASPQIALSAAPAAATIAAAPTGAVRTSNVVTITTTANHNFVTGQFVTIAGVTDTTFNSLTGATQQITVTGLTTFTYAQVGSNTTSGGGTATVQITQTVGRSYQYAWENANTGHVNAPSPASQFVKYNNQIGTVSLFEPGTIASSSGSGTVTGTNTSFSPAWVGKLIVWLGAGNSPGPTYTVVTAVASTTSLTMSPAATANVSGINFVVLDSQVTHARLYATGDSGSVYFRIARNAIVKSNGQSLTLTGFQFSDTSNSAPPNAPFTSEITQNFNVPPPIGQFVDVYQGRPIVYGVTGALQSFFYGNMETTVVGQPPESFAPLNQVTLPMGDGKLNGTANLPTGFILWSSRQEMFKLVGLLSDNTVSNQFQLGATIQRLPYRIGCASPYATAVSSLGAFWLSSDREVWLFTDHYAPKNVGKSIQDILQRVNGARLPFAKMKNFKRGDRNWIALALALDSSTFNNKLCLLDLDLLAANGQPSFFTFDMATNQPTWYLYDINCESIEVAIDNLSQNHLLAGDTDLITDTDWQPAFYTITAEQNVTGGITTHALGNEAPEVVKQLEWMRCNTNQLPSAIAGQGWSFGVLKYDDEQWVLNAANSGNLVSLVPGVNSSPVVIGLENSPADFRFDGSQVAKGRRFQFKVNFPTTPGDWEFRSFQVKYTGLYER